MKENDNNNEYDGFIFYVHARELRYKNSPEDKGELNTYSYYKQEADGTITGADAVYNKMIKIETEKHRNILLAFIEYMQSEKGVEVTDSLEL